MAEAGGRDGVTVDEIILKDGGGFSQLEEKALLMERKEETEAQSGPMS